MMLVASCIPFPFSAPCDDMLAMLIYATCWLSMQLYTLAHMSMHESCVLVCRPCFNTMELWAVDPNLHLSLVDTTFCLPFIVYLPSCLLSCLIAFSFVYLLSCSFAFHVYHAYQLYASFICFLHLFLPVLVCWSLVFAFACTDKERGHIELGHGLLGASKKGEDANMWI